MKKNTYEIQIDQYFEEYKNILKKPKKRLVREDRYPFAEKIIVDTFKEKRNDIEHIYKKVVLLNSLYSTNIFATFDVALNIMRINRFQARVKAGDLSLVNEVRKNLIGDSPKDFYSFATKYCHHHNQEKYPIYDSYVESMLIDYLNDLEPNIRLYQKKMKNYEYFKDKVDHLAKLWNLREGYLYSKLDKYLWQKGKELEN